MSEKYQTQPNSAELNIFFKLVLIFTTNKEIPEFRFAPSARGGR